MIKCGAAAMGRWIWRAREIGEAPSSVWPTVHVGEHRSAEAETTLGLSIVVPVYNEESHLWPMAEALSCDLDRVVGPSQWQFVLVDTVAATIRPK
jgi:hypothetical protein